MLEPRTKVMCVMVVCVDIQHVSIAFIDKITSDCPCWNFRTLLIVVSELQDSVYIRITCIFFHQQKKQRFELLFRFEVFIQR